MERKLELILSFFIILLLITIYFTLHSKKAFFQKKVTQNQESIKSEINNFLAYEVNKSSLLEKIKGKKAIELENYWKLKEANISANNIKSLFSKYSIYKDNKFIFYNNVTAIKNNGMIYKSQTAIYNAINKQLITPSNFFIESNTSNVKGEHLLYNLEKNETKAKNVKGTLLLKK